MKRDEPSRVATPAPLAFTAALELRPMTVQDVSELDPAEQLELARVMLAVWAARQRRVQS